MPKPYIHNTRSQTIRSYLTKIRIDANGTLESKNRSYRRYKAGDLIYRHCGVTLNVKHILVECKMKNLSDTRNLFKNRISKHVRNYGTLSDVSELKTILGLHPHCKHESQCQTIMSKICILVKKKICIK